MVGPNSPFSFHRNFRGEGCFGAIQASVTALSIMCRWPLLHSGQANVRKSWLNVLGSIAVNLIGEPQAVHCGPRFCVSSMCCSSQFGALSSPASHPRKPISNTLNASPTRATFAAGLDISFGSLKSRSILLELFADHHLQQTWEEVEGEAR